jgi:hypothetical protein
MERHVVNGVGHFDVAGPDIAALGHFYREVFGWQPDDKGPGYALLPTPEGSPGGALVESPEPSLTVGIVVPDLDAALERATASGGRVVMPRTDNGWVVKAQVADPAGNSVTLIEA